MHAAIPGSLCGPEGRRLVDPTEEGRPSQPMSGSSGAGPEEREVLILR